MSNYADKNRLYSTKPFSYNVFRGYSQNEGKGDINGAFKSGDCRR